MVCQLGFVNSKEYKGHKLSCNMSRIVNIMSLTVGKVWRTSGKPSRTVGKVWRTISKPSRTVGKVWRMSGKPSRTVGKVWRTIISGL